MRESAGESRLHRAAAQRRSLQRALRVNIASYSRAVATGRGSTKPTSRGAMTEMIGSDSALRRDTVEIPGNRGYAESFRF